MRWPGRDALFLVPLLAFVALFALVPVAVLFAKTLAASGGLSGLRAVWSDTLDQRALRNSMLQGGLSAGIAMAIGYPVGLAIGRYAWPGRSLVRSLLLIPFLLPSLIVVLGVEDLFGARGLVSSLVPPLGVFGSGVPGIVVANLLFNVPLVALFVATGCDAASPELEDTVATLGGGPFQVFRDSWGPPTWVGAVAGGLLTFLFSALSFAPPLMLCGPRCYTVEARIYSLAMYGAQSGAGVLSLLMVLLFLAPTVGYLVLLGRLRPRPGRRMRTRPPLPWRTLLGGTLVAVTGLVLLAEAALFGAVAYRSLRPVSGGGWGGAWGALLSPTTTVRLGLPVVNAVSNTLLFAVGASAITLLLGIAAGYSVAHRRRRAALVGVVLFVPLLLSPIVLSLALTQFWPPLLGAGQYVWALVIFSQTVLALPFALQSIEIPLTGIPTDASDAARTLGATGWGAYLDVDLPRVRDGVVTAGLFALALGMGEFTATNYLVTLGRQYTTLPVALYNLYSSRFVGLQDAVAGLLLLISLATFVALSVGGRRVEL